MHKVAFFFSILIFGCANPWYSIRKNKEAVLVMTFEKACIDSTLCYYFYKSYQVFIQNDVYDFISWIPDETQLDTNLQRVISKKYSIEVYNQFKEAQCLKSPYSYKDKECELSLFKDYDAMHKINNEINIFYMIYAIRGDFVIIKNIDNETMRLYKPNYYCPIEKGALNPPFCAVIACDSTYKVSEAFLKKNKLISFRQDSIELNNCD